MPRGRPRKVTVVEPEITDPEITEPVQPVADSDDSPTDSDKSPPAVVPATFEMVGRILTCTVCGTRASADINRNVFCPNEHNHPLLKETSDVE